MRSVCEGTCERGALIQGGRASDQQEVDATKYAGGGADHGQQVGRREAVA